MNQLVAYPSKDLIYSSWHCCPASGEAPPSLPKATPGRGELFYASGPSTDFTALVHTQACAQLECVLE